MHKKDNTDNLT